MSLKNREDSIIGIRLREAQRTKIATSAELVDGSIVLELPEGGVCTGTMVKFVAPCICAEVKEGLIINEKSYTIVDTHCECVEGLSEVWVKGATISVVIDGENANAYILNGDTNSYLERKFDTINREIDALRENAKIDTGFYIGTGDVEEGCPLAQITADFVPRAVVLINVTQQASTFSRSSLVFVWIEGIDEMYVQDATTSSKLMFTRTGNTLSWCYQYSAADITNIVGSKYFYLVFG